MALKHKPVEMPSKRVTFKKAPNGNGTIYAYYTVRAYRNKKGKPTSDEVAIGKRDPETGMLIPNRRYFEIFGDENEPTKPINSSSNTSAKPIQQLQYEVASYGESYLLRHITREMKLDAVLADAAPRLWEKLLAIAFYMVSNGNVMMYISDWFDETNIEFTEPFDDRRCGEIFETIDRQMQMRFFESWVKQRAENEYIAYDVTSVSTEANIDIAEWGYNRDGEKMPQVNIGMFFGSKTRMPVYYDMYNGSIADKAYLFTMMENAKILGITNVRYVMDQGFLTGDNLTYMQENEHYFVTALPKHLIESRRLIDESKDMIRKSANRLVDYGIYAVIGETTIIDGCKMTAHIYFDPEKQHQDEKTLFAHIDGLKQDLEKMSKSKPASKRYTDFFDVNQDKPEGLEFNMDHDKIDKVLSRTGFFVLLSNDDKLSSEEVLSIYRNKDVVEKGFAQLKNEVDFSRLRTHVNETTNGKVFVGFIALIIRSYLMNRIKGHPETKKMTLGKVLSELRKIKIITVNGIKTALTPLTKQQRLILSTCFHISFDDFSHSLS